MPNAKPKRLPHPGALRAKASKPGDFRSLEQRLKKEFEKEPVRPEALPKNVKRLGFSQLEFIRRVAKRVDTMGNPGSGRYKEWYGAVQDAAAKRDVKTLQRALHVSRFLPDPVEEAARRHVILEALSSIKAKPESPLDKRLMPKRFPKMYEFLPGRNQDSSFRTRPVSRKELEVAVSKRIEELTNPKYEHEKITGYMSGLRRLVKAGDIDSLHEEFEDTRHSLQMHLLPHPNKPVSASNIIEQMARAHIELEVLEEAKRKGFIGPLQKSSLDRKRKGKA